MPDVINNFKFIDAPCHQSTFARNATHNWFFGDSKERYERALSNPIERSHLESSNWISEDAITYKLNSNGFRAPNLEEDTKSVVALGCSFTFGIGLPDYVLWTDVIAKETKAKVFNLGSPGAGISTVFRIADYYLPIIKPSTVAILLPPLTRFEVSSGKQQFDVIYPTDQEIDSLAKTWMCNDDNHILEFRKSLLAIKQICTDINARLFIVDWETHCTADLPRARDFDHPGIQFQQLVAQDFINQGISNE